MKLNMLEDDFVAFWKATDFSNWNESDVREDFIKPLLNILGYAKNTVNDILREATLQLPKSYHSIGRQQVSIDYVPSIRLKKFWIIEAKGGRSKAMNYNDYLQAHLYAVHPEIQVRYIVLINGWEIRLYDAWSSQSWDEVLLLVDKSNCDTQFPQLVSFLHSRSILAAIRKQVLNTLTESLKVEIDEEAANQFRKDFNNVYFDSLPQIRDNVRQLMIASWESREKEFNNDLATIEIGQLLAILNRPFDVIPKISEAVVNRFKEYDQDERNDLLARIVMIYRGRPHASFRVHATYIMCRLIEENIDGNHPTYIKSVGEAFRELVEWNSRYWRYPVDFGDIVSQESFALCHLDNTCIRFSYKLCNRIAMKPLTELLEAKQKTLSKEDLIKDKPSVAQDMISTVFLINEMLWRHLSSSDGKMIWENIWELENLEESLDKTPQNEYPKYDADLYQLDSYGKENDMLYLGTWSAIQMRKQAIGKISLTTEMQDFINLPREGVLATIPKSISKPAGWTSHRASQFIKLLHQVVTELEKF